MLGLLDGRSRLDASSPEVKAGTASPLLPGHCTQVLDIARMVALLGDVELSLNATSDALRNGPPAETAAQGEFALPAGAQDTAGICGYLLGLDAIWLEREAAPDRVYEVLREVVLPASRPSEIFLYALDLAEITTESPEPLRPRSVGLLLCEWAARAGRLDELARLIERRQASSFAEVPARVLLAQIGVRRGDPRIMGESLDWLDHRIDQDSGSITLNLVAHAVLDALARPEGKTRGVAILEHLIRVAGTAQPGLGWPAALSSEIVRERLAHDDLAAARERIGRYVNEIDRANLDSFSLNRTGSRRAFALCLQAGHPSLAWEALGREADRESIQFDTTFVGLEIERLFAGMLGKPAAERFAFLKGWVLPSDPKKPVRFVAVEAPPNGEFQRWSATRALTNTFSLLIDAARESGQLDALAEALKPLEEARARDADALSLMVAIARGRTDGLAPRVLDRVKGLAIPKDAVPSPLAFEDGNAPPNPASRASWLDGLIAVACLQEPPLREVGEEMAGRLLSASPELRPAAPLASRIRGAWASARVAKEAGVPRVAARDFGPSAWVAEAPFDPNGPAEGWVAHEGHLALIPGSPLLPLRLRAPLQGAFEFTCEATDACGIGFGGLSFTRSELGGGEASGASANPFDAFASPVAGTPKVTEAEFHRYRLTVDAGAVRCWIDGRLVHESTDLSRSYPWLSLEPSTRSGVPVVVRNLTITGQPEAMTEVDLIAKGKLVWDSSSASPLGSLGARSSPENSLDSWASIESEGAWTSKGGEIKCSRFDSADGRPQTNLLIYARPLLEGESIRYEFLAKPGEFFVHPALGRRVFLLTPEGLTIRVFGPSDDTLLADEPGRRSPASKPLPLKVGEWNSVAFKLASGVVRCDLNGQTIAETEVRPGDDVRFGLFSFRDQSAARVRAIVLSGTSPLPKPSILADLGDGPALGVEDRRIARAWIGESTLRRNALRVVDGTKGLDPAGRYMTLRSWVLPDGGARPPRIDGEFRRARGLDGLGTASDPEPSSRPVEAVVPAVELVAASKVAGRLDELAGLIQGPGDDPARLALAALIAAEQGRDAETSAHLARLRARLAARPVVGPSVGWPEFVAATAGLKNPATTAEATALLDASADAFAPGDRGSPLAIHLGRRAELARLRDLPAELPSAWPSLEHWLPSSRAAGRDAGLPPAFWTWKAGEVRHFAAHPDDRLTFAQPLLGDFELTSKLSLDPERAPSPSNTAGRPWPSRLTARRLASWPRARRAGTSRSTPRSTSSRTGTTTA